MSRFADWLRVMGFVCFLSVGPGCLVQPLDSDGCIADWCGACLERSGCGWCRNSPSGDDGVCLPGTLISARDEAACTPALWYFRSCDRRGPEASGCAGNSFCSTCVGADGCGWCAEGVGDCRDRNDPRGCFLQTARDACR